MYKLSKRSEERLKGVDPVLIAIIKEAITDSPYDFGIPQYGGLRTAEDQHSIYQRGRELAGSIVTNVDGYKKKSYHQSGKAFDIYGFVNGKATWDKSVLTSIARHLQEVAKVSFDINLEWGGDWESFKDYPHFQI